MPPAGQAIWLVESPSGLRTRQVFVFFQTSLRLKGVWLLRGWIRPLGVLGDLVPGEWSGGVVGEMEKPLSYQEVLSLLSKEGRDLSAASATKREGV